MASGRDGVAISNIGATRLRAKVRLTVSLVLVLIGFAVLLYAMTVARLIG